MLVPVDKKDLVGYSDGFRAERTARQELQTAWSGLMATGGAWVIDLDTMSVFDTLDGKHVSRFLDQRVRDGVIGQTIGNLVGSALRRTR